MGMKAHQLLRTVDGCSEGEKTKPPGVCVVPEYVRARLREASARPRTLNKGPHTPFWIPRGR